MNRFEHEHALFKSGFQPAQFLLMDYLQSFDGAHSQPLPIIVAPTADVMYWKHRPAGARKEITVIAVYEHCNSMGSHKSGAA